MILCNERVDAATALRIGLVEEVVPVGKTPGLALALAQRASLVSPRAAGWTTCAFAGLEIRN